MKTDRELAKIIRKRRKERGLTQEELAQMIGCSRWLVNRVENGKSVFTYAQLIKISEILDYSIPLII